MEDELFILNEDSDLTDVQDELRGTESKWKTIGIQLKLPISCLEKIEQEHKGNVEECSLEMQVAWLRSKRATWKSLAKVLRQSSDRFEEKARSIEKRILSGYSSNHNDDQHKKCLSSLNGQQPQNAFLTEHLEWLLKVGCSFNLIERWVREKKEKAPVAADLEPTHHNDYNGVEPSVGDTNDLPRSGHEIEEHSNGAVVGTTSAAKSCSANNDHSHAPGMAKSKKRQREKKQSSEPKKKKPRQQSSSESPIQFTAINAVTERGRQVQTKKNMLQIIKKLKKHPDAKEFINFVKEERAERYYKIIDYPMCLNEIRDRINRHQCDTRQDFCEEFQAIVDNCVKYNGKDSSFTAQVMRLKAKFDELVAAFLPESGILHSLPSVDTPAEKTSVVPQAMDETVESLPEDLSSSDEDYDIGNEESTLTDGDRLESSQEDLFSPHRQNVDGADQKSSPDNPRLLPERVIDKSGVTQVPAAVAHSVPPKAAIKVTPHKHQDSDDDDNEGDSMAVNTSGDDDSQHDSLPIVHWK